MLARCPQHGKSDEDLINAFMNRLRPADRDWVDAACGGSIMDKLPSQVFKLFAEMAERKRNEDEAHRPDVGGQGDYAA